MKDFEYLDCDECNVMKISSRDDEMRGSAVTAEMGDLCADSSGEFLMICTLFVAG